MVTKKTIFVSFDYENDRKYKNLLLAWDAHQHFDFSFYDGSLTAAINSTNGNYIKSLIKPKILGASRLLCIVGEKTSKSEWIEWEIQTAVDAKKKLIGVKIDKSYTSPSALLNNGASWAFSFTFDAIKKAIDDS